MEEYAIEFQDLAFQTKFNNEAHVEFFQKSLNPKLLRKIYSLPEIPETLEEWVKFAI